jgi:flagellin-like hook-associated protein FlgL
LEKYTLISAANESVNGVFLLSGSKYAIPPAMTHSTLHTRNYDDDINKRLLNAQRGKAGTELDKIKQALLNEIFPK